MFAFVRSPARRAAAICALRALVLRIDSHAAVHGAVFCITVTALACWDPSVAAALRGSSGFTKKMQLSAKLGSSVSELEPA